MQLIDSTFPLPEQQELLLEQPVVHVNHTTGAEQPNYEAPSNLPTATSEESPLIEPLKSWFDGWPDRRRVWNTYSEAWGSVYRRAFACGKHDFIHLVTISGSSLEGKHRFVFHNVPSKSTCRTVGFMNLYHYCRKLLYYQACQFIYTLWHSR